MLSVVAHDMQHHHERRVAPTETPACPPLPPAPLCMQSAFLWGYLATQLLGGTLADKYGGQSVLLLR